jgi:L-aspartate oxidase
MKDSFDIVIVGSGIAGLSTLLYLRDTELFKQGEISICLITKGNMNETNTNWAQGGIAAVKGVQDNFEKHIADTLNAGAYENNNFIVEKVVKAAPDLIKDLINWGTRFDKKNQNEFDLAKEGGHSEARIWHKEDQTGKSIQVALINELKNDTRFSIHEQTSLVNVEKLAESVFGLGLFNKKTNSFSNINCGKLVLATGGLGMLYQTTTNPQIATGDGIYFANKLGAEIENLSYIQFHPTGLYEGGQIAYLITEALRGAGAKLINEKGEAFMHKYDERLELASRDIVSRSILKEIELQKIPYVYLDATHINKEIINAHFPTIKDECFKRLGLNIENDLIPVIPVQHYACGGIKVDEFGESTIKGLFAIGEVASTGLHGANRLASNSLLEAVAFAKFSIPKLITTMDAIPYLKFDEKLPSLKNMDRIKVQNNMSKYAGIIKSNQGLFKADALLNELDEGAEKINEFDLYHFESYILLQVAKLLIKDAINKKENKGVFYNQDLVGYFIS